MSDQMLLLTVLAASTPSVIVLLGMMFWPMRMDNPIQFDPPEEPVACQEYAPDPDLRVLTMRELAAVLQRHTDRP